MARIDDLIFHIQTYAKDKALCAVANAASLNESTIRHLHKPNWNPTAETLRKLESIIPPSFMPDAIAPGATPSIPNPKAESHETTQSGDV